MLDAAVLFRLAEEAGLGSASIVVQRLRTNDEPVLLRPGAAVYPASMIKVPIAMALADRVRRGEEHYERLVTVDAANLTANDAASPCAPGRALALGELTRAAISRSDNVATNVLIDVLGRDAITRYCHSIGLDGTAVRRKLSGALPLIDDPEASGRNAHPARDAARAFVRLARATDDASNLVRDALAKQHWNDKLSEGLRPGDFAHKTGETDETSHDGGILTLPSGHRYVIVVYTDLRAAPENDARLRDFARNLRPFLDY